MRYLVRDGTQDVITRRTVDNIILFSSFNQVILRVHAKYPTVVVFNKNKSVVGPTVFNFLLLLVSPGGVK